MPAPFHGRLFKFTQPDGVEVNVLGWGNQNYATFETLSGYTLVKDPTSGFWVYADVDESGEEYISTGARPRVSKPKGLGVSPGCRISRASAKAKAHLTRLAAFVVGTALSACGGSTRTTTSDAGTGADSSPDGPPECSFPMADCDGVVSNGCETDLKNDPASCGSCGHACKAPPNMMPVCSASVCGVAGCGSGFGDCDGDSGDGCEVNLTTDMRNCGGCGAACVGLPNEEASCVGGVCKSLGCQPGFANCDYDPKNGCETDITSDVTHCGSCDQSGSVCGLLGDADWDCVAGTCVIKACWKGRANCDQAVSNGCEVDLTSDAKHCGACDIVCASSQTCFVGQCQ